MARVIPFRPSNLPHCTHCAAPLGRDVHFTCAVCGVALHDECYWGRIAAFDEWRAYVAWLNDPATSDESDYGVPVRCSACRAEGDA